MRMTAQSAHSCWPSRHQLCYVQVRSLCDMIFTLRISQRCAVAYRTNSTHEQGYLLGVEFSIPKWWWGRQGVNIIWHLQNITYKWRVIWKISKTCNSFNRSLAFSLTKLVGFFFVLDFVEPGNLILLRNAENVHSEGGKKHIPRIISIWSNLYGFFRGDFGSGSHFITGFDPRVDRMCRTMLVYGSFWPHRPGTLIRFTSILSFTCHLYCGLPKTLPYPTL